MVTAKNMILALGSAIAAVVLEEPSEEGKAAQELESACDGCLTVRLMAVAQNPDSDESVDSLAMPIAPGVVNQDRSRLKNLRLFITAAREGLGGDAPGF